MPLFRDEALNYLARQRGPGEPLRVTARWAEPTFWALLLLLAFGLAALIIVQVNGEPLLYALLPSARSLFKRG